MDEGWEGHSCGPSWIGCHGCVIGGARWVLIRLFTEPLSQLQNELIPDIVNATEGASVSPESEN